MPDHTIGIDQDCIEVLRKALVMYYRAWSYYWNQRPTVCVIHPVESFVELPDEVICLLPRGVSEDDTRRLGNAFSQSLMVIAGRLPADCRGYSLQERTSRAASPLLIRFLSQVSASYRDFSDLVDTAPGREKLRQEWRLMEDGQYAKFFDGRTVRLNLLPDVSEPYTFTIIENSPNELYFTESSTGPKGNIIERGSYRKHRHDVGRQTYDNLDLFPEGDVPVLWRMVRAARGFRAFPRKAIGIDRAAAASGA